MMKSRIASLRATATLAMAAPLRKARRRYARRKPGSYRLAVCAASAKVAVARKLVIRLYIMLRDQIDYAEFVRRGSHAGMLGDVALV